MLCPLLTSTLFMQNTYNNLQQKQTDYYNLFISYLLKNLDLKSEYVKYFAN